MQATTTSPRVLVQTQASTGGDNVRFHFKGGDGVPGVASAEFSAVRSSSCLTRDGAARTFHVGLGLRQKAGSDTFRQAGGVAAKAMLRIGMENLAFDLRDFPEHAQAVVEGAILAAYRFEDFKDAKARRRNALKSITLRVPSARLSTASAAAESGRILGESTNLTRSIGNLPPNVIYPASLASRSNSRTGSTSPAILPR